MVYEDNKIMIIDFSFIVLYVVVLALLYNIDLYMYYMCPKEISKVIRVIIKIIIIIILLRMFQFALCSLLACCCHLACAMCS